MKRVLILYPHFPPSNLAGVHRPRLFAQHLPSFGWEPVILTVDEKFYEEKLDHNLVTLLPKNLRLEKANAFNRKGPIGDIGLRAFFQLRKKAKQLIQNEQFDFLYIPIPSFYCALLGRWLHNSTGIKYGIDYIDPWVHHFPGSDKKFSRHWFSTQLAKMLEPFAVKNASLITGVAEGYYEPVLERNPHLKKIVTGAMPYGGEKADHAAVEKLNLKPYLFQKKTGKLIFVYAGAMLPKAYKPLEEIFRAIQDNIKQYSSIEFHFIGTGKSPNDHNGYNIKALAEKYRLWRTLVFEYPARIPYLDVLIHLNIADAVLVLGSTEPHYTPSKVYQAVLAGKAVLAVLHQDSTAVKVIESSHAGIVLSFKGEAELTKIGIEFNDKFSEFILFLLNFDSNNLDQSFFEKYSAKFVTKQLAALLDKAIVF